MKKFVLINTAAFTESMFSFFVISVVCSCVFATEIICRHDHLTMYRRASWKILKQKCVCVQVTDKLRLCVLLGGRTHVCLCVSVCVKCVCN